MTYSVENINSCTKKIVFSFDSLDLSGQINEAVVKKQRSSSLKGFRKGKAPLSLIEQMYGPQIETDALNSFIQSEFFTAVDKEKFRVVGYPSFENMKYEKGKSVCFDALVEIFPEIDLNDYSNLSFTREKVEVTNEDIENVKKNYLNSKAEMMEVTNKDAKLENGHFAVLNFQGVQEDGSRPENMKGEDHLLEIGSNQFIPGFEEGIVGMKSGEEKNLELTFPESYHVEELKNAKVTFEVKLLEIKEKNLPEFTDDMAKEMGYDSTQDLEEKNKENLMVQKERQADQKLHQEILDKLVEENKFDIPKAMLAEQEKHVRDDLMNNLKNQGFTEKMLDEYFAKWAGDVTSKADFQVRSGLILEKLAKKYDVEASDSDLDEKVDEMVKSSGLEADKVREYYTSNEKIKTNMMYAIREEKTFAKLKEELQVK